MASRIERAAAAAVVGSLLVAGCGSQPEPTTVITVYATSAMIHSLTEIGKTFEHNNPGATVEFIFAPSPDLASELSSGAGADVFVSGDPEQMDQVAGAGLIAGAPISFASNRLVMVTAPGNPAHVVSFADLMRPGIRLAECAGQMTCAISTRQLEHQTGLKPVPVAQEVTPTDVIRDVIHGKADVGLVFVSEAVAAGPQITAVDFPEAADAEAICSVALLKKSEQADLSTRFIRELTGSDSRPVLAAAGFGVPPATTGASGQK